MDVMLVLLHSLNVSYVMPVSLSFVDLGVTIVVAHVDSQSVSTGDSLWTFCQHFYCCCFVFISLLFCGLMCAVVWACCPSGKSSESVQCTITGPCLHMRHSLEHSALYWFGRFAAHRPGLYNSIPHNCFICFCEGDARIMDDIVLELFSEVRRVYSEKHTCMSSFVCLWSNDLQSTPCPKKN